MQDTECVVYATVHSIQYDSGWAYIGCKTCSKKVKPISSKPHTTSKACGSSSKNNNQTWYCEDHRVQTQVASRYVI